MTTNFYPEKKSNDATDIEKNETSTSQEEFIRKNPIRSPTQSSMRKKDARRVLAIILVSLILSFGIYILWLYRPRRNLKH